jgi:hypothetical protein
MTLADIIYLVQDEYGARNQLTEQQVLRLLDTVQAMACDADLSALLYWDYYLQVNPSASAGPYSYPSDNDPVHPPCRKILGLTKFTDTEILAAFPGGTELSPDYGLPTNQVDARKLFTQLRLDPIGRTYRILESNLDMEPDTYRLVYFRRPRPLRGAADDTRLVIPAEFHHSTLVQGAGVLARYHLQGELAPREALEPFFTPWWRSLTGAMDQQNRSGMFSQGQPGF